MYLGLTDFYAMLLPFLLFVINLIFLMHLKKEKLREMAKKALTITLFSTAIEMPVMFIGTQINCKLGTSAARTSAIYHITFMLIFLANTGLLFLYLWYIRKKEKLIAMQIENEKLETDMTYYKLLSSRNDGLLSFTHDIKNHLTVIKALNTDKEIDSYICEMLEMISRQKPLSDSGNRLLDIILGRYSEECAAKGISLAFDVSNNSLQNFENHDMVTVLGNLLDNAAEAAENSEKKVISFVTDNKNGYNIIIITNSCDSVPEFAADNTPISTKSPSEYHGIGIKNVKNVLKKYDGDVEFIYDINKRLFTVTVMMKAQA